MLDHQVGITTDYALIRRWAEKRGGRPVVSPTPEGSLRLAFPPDRAITADEVEVSWDWFFKTFHDRRLALLYQRRTRDGGISHFCRLVDRVQAPEAVC